MGLRKGFFEIILIFDPSVQSDFQGKSDMSKIEIGFNLDYDGPCMFLQSRKRNAFRSYQGSYITISLLAMNAKTAAFSISTLYLSAMNQKNRIGTFW